MTWIAVAVVVAAYLLGSVDFAVWVARAKGVDIYDVGSGNPGTANVARILGWRTALWALVGDALKGVAAASAGLFLAGSSAAGFAAGLAAVVGHCYPVWHRLRGGKGVATAGGTIAVLAPVVTVALIILWLLVARLVRVSSVASVSAVVLAVPLMALTGHRGWSLVWVGLMALLIVARHRPNLARLLRGEEPPTVFRASNGTAQLMSENGGELRG